MFFGNIYDIVKLNLKGSCTYIQQGGFYEIEKVLYFYFDCIIIYVVCCKFICELL